MRKLLISFFIILMFSFSLNKYNSIEEKKLDKKKKKISIIKIHFLEINKFKYKK